MRSHLIIIATSKNADENSLQDLGAAVATCGAHDVEIADNGVIEATVPSYAIGIIERMEGVVCVRNQFTYAEG